MSIMNLRIKWSSFAFVAVIIIVISAVTSATSFPTVLALKKLSAGSGSSTASDVTSSAQNQIKGLKILQVRTSPSTVLAGGTFNILAIVVNNSTATITFPNGTCNSPVSVDFNKNVITENIGTASCTGSNPEVTLKPGDKSKIASPDMSGVAYKAVTPGSTNATITFNYGVSGTTAVPSASNTITRVYTFTVQPSSGNGASQAGSQPTSATNTPIFNPIPQSTVSTSSTHSGHAASNTTATGPSNLQTKATGSRSLTNYQVSGQKYCASGRYVDRCEWDIGPFKYNPYELQCRGPDKSKWICSGYTAGSKRGRGLYKVDSNHL